MRLDGHNITYRFTDLVTFKTLAELPLKGVTFSQVLCGAGPFGGTLPVEDPSVINSNWINATVPWKTAVWIDIDDGSFIAYGGVITGRKYTMSKQSVALTGSSFWTYFAQRLQAKDYSTNWAVAPGGSAGDIAGLVLADALASPHSVPITIVPPAIEAPTANWITMVSAISQQQSVSSLVTQLQQLGYEVGIDFADDPVYVAGVPVPVITLDYPRRGRPAGTTEFVIDVSNAIDFDYDEDGTQQSNGVVEMIGASGGTSTESIWDGAFSDGWPLLEQVISHAAYSSSTTPAALLQALALADLSVHAYPFTVPEVTMPLFGSYPQFGQYKVGDDMLLYVPKLAGSLPPVCPRFPNGLAYYFRSVRHDVTIADQGLSTVKITMNIPPNTVPQTPPA
jgi:hypothetical protein